MRRQIVAAAVTAVIIVISTVADSIVAQGSDVGATLVCVPGDGASTALLEFSPEQIVEYDARWGHEPARAHPVTGICQDPAGLPIGEGNQGWTPGWSWACLREADGSSAGPVWLLTMNPGATRVLPDPTTGRCPEPQSRIFGSWALANPAAATAIHMTELEVAEDYQRLFAWMHPDAQAIVPREAVEGWYREVFAVRKPTWMTVDDVRLVEWTWEVTGKVYPSAAEVTFRQRFEDGAETKGVTHFVRDNGVWRWFFGSNREFVQEQITKYVADKLTAEAVWLERNDEHPSSR